MSSLLPGATSKSQGLGAPPQETQAKIPDDPISYDSLTLEIALARKTLADERFLASDLTGARDAYCSAREEVSGGLQLSTAKSNTLELLKADIDYRLLLLDRGIDFWGAVQTLTPHLPRPHLASLEGLLAEFEKLSSEITAAGRQIGAADIETGKLEAISREIDGRVKAENVNQQRIAIERTFQEQRQDSLDSRIVELKANRQRLENQIASAVARARAASAQLSKALVNAATSSLGIPPDVVQSMKDGKLDKAVLAAVTSSDLLKSADFSSALAEIGASNEVIAGYVKQGQDLVRRGQEVKQQVESYKADLEFAAQTFRNPSVAGLTRVGEQIYAKLDNNTKREWAEKISSARPVLGAVELVRTFDDPELARRLREGAERYLASDANFARDYLRTAINRYVGTAANAAASQIGAEYAKLLGDISKLRLDDDAVEHLLDQVLRSWPTAFLDRLSSALIQDLIRVAGAQNREDLLEQLRERGLKLIKERIIVRSDRVDVYDRSRPPRSPVVTIRLLDLGTLPQGKPIEKYGAAAREAFENELERLRGADGDLRQLLLKRMPQDILEGALRRSLTLPENTTNREDRETELKSQAWEAIVRSLPTEAQRERVVERITSAHVGSMYVTQWEAGRQEQAEAEQRRYAGARSREAAGEDDEKPSPDEAMAEKVALLALNAVIPGASVAVDVVKSFFAFGEAIDKAKRLAAELQANLSEELQLIELINEARLKQVVLGKEREISEIMKASAKAQYESYRFAVTQVDANQDKERGYIALRRKLAFYLAERMREEFDGLDRSLALWAGRTNSPRGVIAELIKSDPQNLRLALDSEIHLFDWLNRERESTRADVDGLIVHWRQLVRLSKDLCQRLGCSTGIGALGQVHQTDAIRLTDLLSPEDRRRLRSWQSSGSYQPLSLTLFLQPDGRFVPLSVDNVRVVDVRIGAKWPSGRLTALTRVRLSHPGVGYVQSGRSITRQVLLPVQRWGHAPPEAFDTQEIVKSWQVEAGLIREFEGYPLYSAWGILLEPVEENLKSEEIWIRFAYRYIDRANITTERQYLDTTSEGPPGLFEPAIIWKNEQREAQITDGGRTYHVALPSEGRVSIPFSAVSLLNADRPARIGNPCEAQPVGTASTAKMAHEPSVKPALFAICKPDEDIKRALVSHFARKEPNERRATALAKAEFTRLKDNECRGPRPIRTLEVRP